MRKLLRDIHKQHTTAILNPFFSDESMEILGKKIDDSVAYYQLKFS